MSSSVSTATQSLADILPWGSPASSSEGCSDALSSRTATLLVTDSVSADGRFILHALALQYLSTRHSCHGGRPELLLEGSVLWISSAPVSEKQLLLCMRKGLQHNLGGSGSRIGSTNGLIGKADDNPTASSGSSTAGRINVISVPLELAGAALESETVDMEEYTKLLHARVVRWLKDRCMESSCSSSTSSESKRVASRTRGPALLVIDNATALASLLGERLAGCLVASLRGSMARHSAVASKQDSPSGDASISVTNLLAIRATSPDDGGLYQIGGALQGDKIRSEHARILRPWLGMGSGISDPTDENSRVDVPELEEKSNYQLSSIAHKWGLYEMADGIVDVSPLESGYARDVLGRLSFLTTHHGRGWWGTKTGKDGKAANVNETFSINYKCDESGVRTMRLRSS